MTTLVQVTPIHPWDNFQVPLGSYYVFIGNFHGRESSDWRWTSFTKLSNALHHAEAHSTEECAIMITSYNDIFLYKRW